MKEKSPFASNPGVETVAKKVYGVRLEDGRLLSFATAGRPDGFPVFYAHGMPGSHVGLPRSARLAASGVLAIGIARPGCGYSDRQERRTVADYADGIRQIADKLGIDKFGVVGRSGGGPHALACAADPRLRGRVTYVAALASPAPPDIQNLGDWLEGFADSNLEIYGEADGAAAAKKLEPRARQIREDSRILIDGLWEELRPSDHNILGEVAIRTMLEKSYESALMNGVDGWLDDVRALKSPWGFELSDVQAPKVELWAAGRDDFSPPEHTLAMEKLIPGAEVHLAPNLGHFSALEVLPKYLIRAVPDDWYNNR